MVQLSDLAYQDSANLTPWGRVKVANELGLQSSLDPGIRKLAGEVLAGCQDIPGKGSATIAQWIRDNFEYLQESPGVEVLQGPYTSLFTRVVDCDDAAILFMALCRAAGIRAFFCGVGPKGSNDLVHAVGYDADKRVVYELIDDTRYGGSKGRLQFVLPRGYYLVYYNGEPETPARFLVSGDGRSFTSQERGSNMACRSCLTMGKASFTGSTSPGGKTSPSAGDTSDWWDASTTSTAIETGGGWVQSVIDGLFGGGSDAPESESGSPVDTGVVDEEVVVEDSSFPVLPLVIIAGLGIGGYLLLRG